MDKYNLIFAQKALTILSKKLEENDFSVGEKDGKWFNPLRDKMGAGEVVMKDPEDLTKDIKVDCTLRAKDFDGNKENLTLLRDTLLVLTDASHYEPEKVKLGDLELPVHNHSIATKLKASYSQKEFNDLSAFLESNKLFNVGGADSSMFTHETGFIRTSGVESAKDVDMTRQWVTDTVRCGDIQKEKDPKNWKKALNALAKFYNMPEEQEAFEKAISNPANYHAGKPEEGVAHIFYPDTLKRDPNYRTNQRLESHGLALKAFVDNIVDGVVEDKKWGYKTEKEVEKPTIKAISSLAGFFKAIDYPTAPSVGNWEEFPFPGGLTSDTEMIRSSFESLHDLMYNPSYDKNPIIASVRERLVKTEYGSFLSDEKELKRLVKIGKERVQKTYLEESPNIRPHDSSLAFVTSSTIKLDNDPLRDIEKHMEILDSLEKHLVKDNGMVRFTSYDFLLKDGKIHSSDSSLGKEGKADIEHVYSSDSYISLNYNVALDREGKINLKWKDLRDEFGSCDARDPAAFGVRPHFSNPNSDAQWFMVGDMASGYGKQLEKLLKITDGRTATKEEQKLIDKTLSKSTEYLNRSLARVTENNPTEKSQITANGVKCQSFCVPEAYQHVSSLKKDENGNSKEVLIPGINTPLAWATASLFKAMNQCRGNIKELEKRKQHDNNVVTSEKMRSKLSR